MTVFLTEECVGISATNSGCLGLLLAAYHGFLRPFKTLGFLSLLQTSQNLEINPVQKSNFKMMGAVFKALVAYLNKLSRTEL